MTEPVNKNNSLADFVGDVVVSIHAGSLINVDFQDSSIILKKSGNRISKELMNAQCHLLATVFE